MNRARSLVVLLIATLAWLVLPAGVDAAATPAIAPLTINGGVIERGSTVALTALTVSNVGDRAGTITMNVTTVLGQSERAPGAGWFSFDVSEFVLGAGQSRLVGIALSVPALAADTDYRARLTATTSPTGSGAVIGVTVATVVTFTAVPNPDEFREFEPDLPEPRIDLGDALDGFIDDDVLSAIVPEGKTLSDVLDGSSVPELIADFAALDALDDIVAALVEAPAVASAFVAESLEEQSLPAVLAAFDDLDVLEQVVAPIIEQVLQAQALPDLIAELAARDLLDVVVDAIVEQIAGDSLIAQTVGLDSAAETVSIIDETSGEAVDAVQVMSLDERVGAIVPVGAVDDDVVSISLAIEAIDDLRTLEQNIVLPVVAEAVDAVSSQRATLVQAVSITISDQAGTALTEFDQALTFTIPIDLEAVDVAALAVLFFDPALGEWVQVPSTARDDGTITFATRHLSLVAVVELPALTRTFAAGLNPFVFTGPTGTTARSAAEQIGGPLLGLFRFDAAGQSWQAHLADAPHWASNLKTLRQRDALFAIVRPDAAIEWTTTDLIPVPGGVRTVSLAPGLNAIGFTGPDRSRIATVMRAAGRAVASVSLFDRFRGWLTYVPGAPQLVNTLVTVDRLDAFYVFIAAPQPLSFELPEVAPHARDRR